MSNGDTGPRSAAGGSGGRRSRGVKSRSQSPRPAVESVTVCVRVRVLRGEYKIPEKKIRLDGNKYSPLSGYQAGGRKDSWIW